MAEIVIKNFDKPKKGARSGSVTQKRVRDASTGKFVIVRTINGHSETLGEDLDYVFRRNVEKARRDNKAVTGAPDRVPGRG
ncbi:hypothetical protein [Aureimonas frigidaquae]|uniref:hypothetical protein n=1 Tax=Aureimonas frigidaquae TaxID=424757 RepID=UPI000786097A|nr:hypothetical protein [Aureimonas frigidaquae]